MHAFMHWKESIYASKCRKYGELGFTLRIHCSCTFENVRGGGTVRFQEHWTPLSVDDRLDLIENMLHGLLSKYDQHLFRYPTGDAWNLILSVWMENGVPIFRIRSYITVGEHHSRFLTAFCWTEVCGCLLRSSASVIGDVWAQQLKIYGLEFRSPLYHFGLGKVQKYEFCADSPLNIHSVMIPVSTDCGPPVLHYRPEMDNGSLLSLGELAPTYRDS